MDLTSDQLEHQLNDVLEMMLDIARLALEAAELRRERIRIQRATAVVLLVALELAQAHM